MKTREELLAEIKKLEAELHEAEQELTDEEKKAMIHGMDDEYYETKGFK